MIESRLSAALRVVAATCLFGLAAVSAFANTVTYDFTYAGTGTYVTEAVTGSGSFTADFTPGVTTGTLDSFSFTDTFAGTDGTSTFNYTSAAGTILFATGSPYSVTNVSLTTPYVTGTNSAFGTVDFRLAYSGVTGDSTRGSDASASDQYADFSTGGGTITLAPAVPEPGNVGLLAFAALGMGILYRSRRRAFAEASLSSQQNRFAFCSYNRV